MKGKKSLALTIACLSILSLAGCAALSSLFGLTPTADIKDGDRTVAVGALVELDGRQSSSNVSYKWTMKSKPPASAASIANATAAIASFTADQEGSYQIELTVSQSSLSASVTVVISAKTSTTTTTTIPSSAPVVTATPGDGSITLSWTTIANAGSYLVYYTAGSTVTKLTGSRVAAPKSPYALTGLTNGTEYAFVVTAVIGSVESAESPVVKATPAVAVTAPSAPVASATSGDGSVVVSWPDVTGASSYNLYYLLGSEVGTANGDRRTKVTSPYKVSNLTNGSKYAFIVTAINAIGESAPSAVVTATPAVATTAPAAPVATVEAGDAMATLTWDPVASAASYNVYWKAGSSASTSDTKISGAKSPYTKTGLTNDTQYAFVVTAVNAIGEGAASAVVTATPVAPTTVSKPSSPSVTVTAGNGKVSIAWQPVSGADSYNLYYKKGKQVAAADADATSVVPIPVASPYLLTGLDNDSEYAFIMTAKNTAGESLASAVKTATPVVSNSTSPPSAPANPGGEAGDGQVTVSWDQNLEVTSYTLYWLAGSTVTIATGTPIIGITGTSYTIVNLVNGTSYAFVVSAVNDIGESSASSLVIATPKAAAPTIATTSPAKDAVGVGAATTITATFSTAMDPATITAANFTLTAGTAPVTGAVTYSASTKVATFTPASALAYSTTYTAKISTAVKDAAGTAMTTDKTWSFTTAGTVVAPTVTTMSPAAGATGVGATTTISAIFDADMNQSTISTASFTLEAGTAPVSGTVSYDSPTRTATFTPTSALVYSTTYTAKISTAAKDSSGTAMAADKTWTFTTKAQPTVTSTSPLDAATNVARTLSAITATFSAAMDSSTISTTTFSLWAGALTVAGTVSYNTNTLVASFTPTSTLDYATTYTAKISTAVKDSGGTAMAAEKSWTFTTATAAPTITAIWPTANSTGFGVLGTVSATFSTTEMNPATITTTSFTLRAGTTPVTGTVSYSNNTAVFTPSAALAFSTTYTAKVSTAVTNLAGTAMAADKVWTFTTAAPALPAVTTTSISVTETAATGGGNVTDDGGAAVTARGICWSTSTNPTTVLTTKTSNGTGTGSYSSSLWGLTGGTLYYVRAYATNSTGTAYGSQVTFTFPALFSSPGGSNIRKGLLLANEAQPRNLSYVFIDMTNALYSRQSTNGGETWSTAYSMDSSVYDVVADIDNTGDVVALWIAGDNEYPDYNVDARCNSKAFDVTTWGTKQILANSSGANSPMASPNVFRASPSEILLATGYGVPGAATGISYVYWNGTSLSTTKQKPVILNGTDNSVGQQIYGDSLGNVAYFYGDNHSDWNSLDIFCITGSTGFSFPAVNNGSGYEYVIINAPVTKNASQPYMIKSGSEFFLLYTIDNTNNLYYKHHSTQASLSSAAETRITTTMTAQLPNYAAKQTRTMYVAKDASENLHVVWLDTSLNIWRTKISATEFGFSEPVVVYNGAAGLDWISISNDGTSTFLYVASHEGGNNAGTVKRVFNP